MNANPDTLFVGRNLISKDIIDSTNNLAASLLSESRLPEGSVIIANEQNAGRGQQGTTWESAHGKNLLTSFIFYPSFLNPKNIFNLNITFSLALHDFAKALLQKDVSVKWPNDLYYQNKKLAGLLIENSIRNNEFNYSIIGIGINVNQTKFSPNALNPTSFKIVLEEDLEMQKVFELLCKCIEVRYLQLKSLKTNSLKSEYLNILYRFNQTSTYNFNGKTISGKIIDVMDDGKLLIENEEGNAQAFGFKEISFITS